jgi:hypothetical protein
MQKVKMVDYAHTDPRSFKNTLLLNQACVEDANQDERIKIAPMSIRTSKHAKEFLFQTVMALIFGSSKAASQMGLVCGEGRHTTRRRAA